jgi:hypothetical protein
MPYAPRLPWSRRGWWLYLLFWLTIGLALALAEAQHPQRPAARRVWEPFVLEITSLLAVGLLALVVYRWVARLAGRPWPQQLAAHAAGAAAFFVAHVALMHALRIPFYAALAGRLYAPMSPLQLLLFEGPKDLVSYVVVSALSMLVLSRLAEQQQREQVVLAQAALAELRLARLADQLQPHFLFNCLNTVAALIDEDPSGAVTMVARIGDFLRAALDHDGEAGINLGEELRLAELYLAIQRVRFGGGIEVAVDVPAALRTARVPHLVLQPLVENAVKHGAVRPGAPLHVRIAAAVGDGALQISVANSVAGPVAAANPGIGHGLDLVRQRLALLFGDAAALSVDPPSGVCEGERPQHVVRLRLPKPPSAP